MNPTQTSTLSKEKSELSCNLCGSTLEVLSNGAASIHVCASCARTCLEIFETRSRAGRPIRPNLLSRLKETQCCDVVIDGMIGAAIERIQILETRARSLLNTMSRSDKERYAADVSKLEEVLRA